MASISKSPRKRRRVQTPAPTTEETNTTQQALGTNHNQLPNPEFLAMMQSCITAAIPTIAETVLASINGGQGATGGQEPPTTSLGESGPSLSIRGNQQQVSESVTGPATPAAKACLSQMTAGPSTDSEYQQDNVIVKRNLTKQIDLGLDPKIKNKIVSDEYVDIGLLLNPGQDNKEKFTTEVKDGSLSLVKVPSTKKIDSINQWLNCFNVFGAIYSKRHPECGHKLFQYARRVQAIAEESGDSAAIAYDKGES